MKTQFKSVRWLFLLGLAITGAGATAQQNQDPTQTVCTGIQAYHVDPNPIPGATYSWDLSGGGTIISGNGTNAVNVNWDTPGGPYTLSVFTTTNGCVGLPTTVDVTVVAQPVGPAMLAQTPPGPGVCTGTQVSATFTAGT